VRDLPAPAGAPAGWPGSVVSFTGGERVGRPLLLEEPVHEGALLVQPLELAGQTLHLAFQSSEPPFGGGIGAATLEAGRDGATDLRIEDHRYERDHQRHEEYDKEEHHMG
jgi:hypothetical protein